MSLSAAQRARTATEFASNLAASGLSRDELRERTGLLPARFDSALSMAPGTDPADAWLVRDTLEAAVAEAGAALTPFTVLTEEARTAIDGSGITDRR
ncbi:DUF2316 family protein [Brachybacterium nesterenkovii]|uniref:DUF2316 family protein n=1 Tax=Brachybacterium nesterenkovii TaxID=47847 RepID=UPI00321AC463